MAMAQVAGTGVMIDNGRPLAVGPSETGEMVKEDNTLGLDEQVQLLASKTVALKELTYSGANIVLPLSSSGLVLTSNYSVGDAGGVTLTYPLMGPADRSSALTLAFDFSNRRAASLGGRVAFKDWIGGDSTAAITFAQGLGASGTHATGFQLDPRPGSSLDGNKINIDLRHTQPLPDAFSLSLGLIAQKAFAVLPRTELFSLGGGDFGRGYDGGIIAGDSGVSFKTEIAYAVPVDLPLLALLQPTIGIDWGATHSALAGPQEADGTVASAGIGTRFALTSWLGGKIELDRPITRPPVAVSGAKYSRAFLQLSSRF